MRLIIWQLNAPIKARPAYAQILQRHTKPVKQFIPPCSRLYVRGIFLYEINKLLLISAHFEKVAFFLQPFGFLFVYWAAAINQITFIVICLTVNTIMAFIMALVHISVLLDSLKQLLYNFVVPFFCC